MRLVSARLDSSSDEVFLWFQLRELRCACYRSVESVNPRTLSSELIPAGQLNLVAVFSEVKNIHFL